MLSKQAFNGLLKTLEEPPASLKFILATTDAHKIPSTIISRCQRFDFRRISNNDGRDGCELSWVAPSYRSGQQILISWPVQVFGQQGMKYLSDQYRFSKYMTECGAGQVRLKYEEPPFKQLPDACIIGERM